jgi:hypothetical protein
VFKEGEELLAVPLTPRSSVTGTLAASPPSSALSSSVSLVLELSDLPELSMLSELSTTTCLVVDAGVGCSFPADVNPGEATGLLLPLTDLKLGVLPGDRGISVCLTGETVHSDCI